MSTIQSLIILAVILVSLAYFIIKWKYFTYTPTEEDIESNKKLADYLDRNTYHAGHPLVEGVMEITPKMLEPLKDKDIEDFKNDMKALVKDTTIYGTPGDFPPSEAFQKIFYDPTFLEMEENDRKKDIGNIVESVKQHKEKEEDKPGISGTTFEIKLGDWQEGAKFEELNPSEIVERFGNELSDVDKAKLEEVTKPARIIKEEDLDPDTLDFFKSLKLKDGKITKNPSKE